MNTFTLVCSMPAPRAFNVFRHSTWPLAAARIRAVSPVLGLGSGLGLIRVRVRIRVN